MKGLAAASRPAQWAALTPRQIAYLAQLPVTRRLVGEGETLYLVHATPRDPLDEYLGPDADAWADRLAGIEADFVLVGHTHRQFEVAVETDRGPLRVINPGSVGQPRDGDPRAAYAVIVGGRAELKRVPYDIEAAVRSLENAGIDPAAVRELAGCLRNGKTLSRQTSDA